MYRQIILSVVVGGVVLGACCTDRLWAGELSVDDAKLASQNSARAALEFGVAGDQPQRDAKLAEAISLDPDCALARWHLGQLQVAHEWLPISAAEAALAADEHRQSYLKKRSSLNGDPTQELNLARWCSAQQLTDYAEFHYGQVLQNPNSSDKQRDEALRRLGLKWHDGAWLTGAQIEQAERRATAQQQAAKKWSSRVQRWVKAINRGNPRQVEFARQQMREVDDLAIIPLLEREMSSAGEAPAREVVAWLAEYPQFEATESLLAHALDAPWTSVREDAIKALSSRPLHEYVPQLLGQLVPPIESRVTIRVSPYGAVLHQHELLRSGQTQNDLARADFMETAWRPGRISYPRTSLKPTSRISVRRADGHELTPEERAKAAAEIRERTRLLAWQASLRSAMIERNVAQANRVVAEQNDRIYPVLEGTTSAEVPNEPELWWDWWDTYNEQYVPPKNTRLWYGSRTQYHGPMYHVTRMSCFVAGTLVRTDVGLVPIETIQPGDRVLSQDVDSGELQYKVVTTTTQRPQAALLEIVVGDSAIQATQGHPFWVNGLGWRMAKRLNVGDVVHTLDGPRSVHEVNTKGSADAHNLVVDDFSTYFVSKAGVLVHDNKPRQPTLALTPGLVRED